MIVKCPLSWLRAFAPIKGSNDEIADQLNNLGMVVEGIQQIGQGLDGVVVGHVVDVRDHPNADKVRLCDVDLGNGEPIQIACGAPNIAPGQKVPVATIGATLPGDFHIERRKLRGEWSNGMICSSRELRLDDDHGGIMILPDDLTPGAPFAESVGIATDVVFELAIETNRPDAMSMAGVARDLAALQRVPFALPEPEVEEAGGQTEDLAGASVARPDMCPRLTVKALVDVRIGESPDWVKARLRAAGMRPINNVVDASNYVMLELGQPTHPYDLDRLPGKGIKVRAAHAGEKLTTLDGVVRTLNEADCVITDGKDEVVGIAGVMGGASSEIHAGTTRVLLEAAYFVPSTINRTSKRLGLRSEASSRFERGCDPGAIERAVKRFCELLGDDASPARGWIDTAENRAFTRTLTVRPPRVNQLLGTRLSVEEMVSYLEPIGFRCAPAGESLEVEIPSFRPDATQEIDIVEEVARHHGYRNIETTVPLSAQVGLLTPAQRLRREVQDVLTGFGAHEAWTSVFFGPRRLEQAGYARHGAVEVTNPLSKDESLLRPSLLPGLLGAVAFNASHRNENVRLFEVGRVFGQPVEGETLPNERERVAVALARGDDNAEVAVRVWRGLSRRFGWDDVSVVNDSVAGLHPTRSGRLEYQGATVGLMGEVDPQVLASFDIERRVGWLEFDLQALAPEVREYAVMTPVSRFPSSDIDLAFVVPDDVPADQVLVTLRHAGGELLETVELFDVYRGEGIDEGLRGLAYRLRFGAPDRTLTDQEVGEVRRLCIEAVEREHAAYLR